MSSKKPSEKTPLSVEQKRLKALEYSVWAGKLLEPAYFDRASKAIANRDKEAFFKVAKDAGIPDEILKRFDEDINQLDLWGGGWGGWGWGPAASLVAVKKLLLIRPVILNDSFTVNFSYPASKSIGTKALAEGWQLTELAGDAANRNFIEDSITNGDPDFIIHYDHGGTRTLFGQMNNSRDNGVIDANNVKLLTKAVISTVSCSSAAELGQLAVAANGRQVKAYMGYRVPMGCEYEFSEYFERAANAANFALLEGETFQRAQEIGYKKYSEEIEKLLALNDSTSTNLLAVIIMYIDRDHLIYVGNGSATAHM